jgi:hypothetical protein
MTPGRIGYGPISRATTLLEYERSLPKVKADVFVSPSGDEMQADSKTVLRVNFL